MTYLPFWKLEIGKKGFLRYFGRCSTSKAVSYLWYASQIHYLFPKSTSLPSKIRSELNKKASVPGSDKKKSFLWLDTNEENTIDEGLLQCDKLENPSDYELRLEGLDSKEKEIVERLAKLEGQIQSRNGSMCQTLVLCQSKYKPNVFNI